MTNPRVLNKDRVDQFLADVKRTVEIPDALAIGYALDKLSPEERTRLDELLTASPDARAELDALREAASKWRRNDGEAHLVPAAATRRPAAPEARAEAADALRQRFQEAAEWFVEQRLSPALAGVAYATAGRGERPPIRWSLRPTTGGLRVRIASKNMDLEGVRLNVSVDHRVYVPLMTREWPDVVSAEFTICDEEGDQLSEKPRVTIAVTGQDGPEPPGAGEGMIENEGSS
ncbi:MAG: hypothetical protein OXH69_10645 [Acidobacteria bacterium]|nr:hypothetical protein [Acidobacteriota bacterium]